MPEKRGTRTDLIGRIEVPQVTIDPKDQFPQQPQTVNVGGGQQLQVPMIQQPSQGEVSQQPPSNAANLSKIQIPGGKPGEYEYKIGDKIVSQADYENARIISRGEAGFVSPQLQQQMGDFGLQPFAQQQQQEMQRQAMAQQVGQQPGAVDPVTGQPMAQGQLRPLDWQQVALYATTDPQSLKEIGTIVGGAAIGAKMLTAVKGASLTGNPYIIGAAAVGALALGIYSSVRTNIKNQRTDEVKAQLAINRDAEKWKNQLIGLSNTDPENAHVYLGAFQELDNKQRDAWYKLEQASRNNLNLALGEDATIELQRFRNYYQAGGGYDVQNTKMQLAIASPNFEQGMKGLLASSESIGGELS